MRGDRGHRVRGVALLAAAALAAALAGCSMRSPQASREADRAYAPWWPNAPAATIQQSPGGPASRPAILAAGQGDGWAGFESAWSLLATRDYPSAEEALRVWLSVHGPAEHPRTPKALLWLGYAREKQNRLRPALETYGELERRYPESAEAAVARGRAAALTVPALMAPAVTAPALKSPSAP